MAEAKFQMTTDKFKALSRLYSEHLKALAATFVWEKDDDADADNGEKEHDK